MPIIYQIRDWDTNFENDRSRARRSCSFVCVPNKQHGMSFCRIMSQPDGAAIYGIWNLILGACSQQTASPSRPRNGWLTSNGEHTGSAWGAADLALKFRRPEAEITRALQFLSLDEIGWLIRHDVSDIAGLPTQSPPAHHAVTACSPRKKEGKEGKEGKEAPQPSARISTAERITAEKELVRVEAAIRRIDESVDGHRELSQPDRLKRADLRERKAELLSILGMKV